MTGEQMRKAIYEIARGVKFEDSSFAGKEEHRKQWGELKQEIDNSEGEVYVPHEIGE